VKEVIVGDTSHEQVNWPGLFILLVQVGIFKQILDMQLIFGFFICHIEHEFKLTFFSLSPK
jgi:hypothetical protein